jgi:hypothetical protein
MIGRKRMVIGFLLVYGAFLSSVIKLPEKKFTHIEKKKSIVEQKIHKYCKDEYIANILSKSKRPYIMAAIAKVESDYRPHIIGDGGDSYGMFQINRRFHKWPNDGLECQLNASERILNPLIVQYGLTEGIRRYNGRGKDARRYAQRVITIAKEIENG